MADRLVRCILVSTTFALLACTSVVAVVVNTATSRGKSQETMCALAVVNTATSRGQSQDTMCALAVVNTATSRGKSQETMCALPSLRDTFKAALRSGKIRQVTKPLNKTVNNMAAARKGTCARITDSPDVFDTSTWDRFMKECDDTEWKDFERLECIFRQSIATKPMHVKTTFFHHNPSHWFKLSDLMTDIFFRDGTFQTAKPNGVPHSMPFLKCIKRMLRCFPVDVPETFPLTRTLQ
eukprot:TRINITY_DN4247_c0_g1_i1.p2 TRINITY_DN4247_c0_g1~~TRINITY_DN4247_c0_g1_i1.p2  ORF type:complete len:260 (+),score=24.51 TRINITY_DN4247_c0_g1_i1:68-781(+)